LFFPRPSLRSGRRQSPKNLTGSPRSSKTAKEPEKYRLEPHFLKIFQYEPTKSKFFKPRI